jgi:hypothetical protein
MVASQAVRVDIVLSPAKLRCSMEGEDRRASYEKDSAAAAYFVTVTYCFVLPSKSKVVKAVSTDAQSRAA